MSGGGEGGREAEGERGREGQVNRWPVEKWLLKKNSKRMRRG